MKKPQIKQEMLFRRIYKGLKQLVPEMIGNEKPDFWLKHEDKKHKVNNAFALRRDDNLLEIGTTYYVNGDLCLDPQFIVLFDNALQFARVAEWTVDTPASCFFDRAICENFDCENINAIETHSEREANSVLFLWLNTFAEKQKENPNYFKKLDRN
ncbi:MAG: hypothetical protein FWB91_04590 [Defluviitaleaceae bacterium]|nr:hypothetical protein [Defluviitaleaceae bacterium]